MIDVLLAEDVRRLDAEAEAAGTPVARLMENAGWAVARTARRMTRGTYGRRVTIVCGKGNNGGDGLVAARLLLEAGARPTVILLSDPASLSPLAAANLARFRGTVARLDALPRELARADLVIDAIFGVGLSRAPEGEPAEAIAEIDRASARVLAVDVPSGVNADTGAVPSVAVRADDTITFAGFKPGLLFEPGRSHAGQVHIAPIGTRGAARAHALDPRDVRALIPTRAPDTNKRRAGALLVVAGSRAMPGAAALTCDAAVRAGAGLTTLCAPEDVCRVVTARVPEITTIPVPESSEGTIDPKALDLIRPRLEEFKAVAIGPGLTTHPAAVELVRALVAEARAPMVVDADGLNALAGATEVLRARRGFTVLTPHAGELSRLTGKTADELNADRLARATEAAHELRATVVFKGPGTVITDGTTTFVNEPGGPALAQGGTGDVLTGIVGTFLALGLPDPRLAAAAVWLHGYAAERIAARAWPQPASATALIDELGPTMHDVLNA